MALFNFFGGNRKGIGLALGGGSIRGYAHLGVLRVLEKNKIPIHSIAGSSAGAIVGALYAGGLPLPKMEKLLMELDWFRLAWPNFNSKSPGFFSGKKIKNLIEDGLGLHKFKELKIPFAVSCTDIISANEYVFYRPEDPLGLAVMASSAIPAFFSPVDYKGMSLVDASLCNNLPVSLLDRFNPPCKVAVNVVPRVPLDASPKDLLELVFRANDIYILKEFSQNVEGANLILDPIKQYISSLRPSKKLYERLIEFGEKEATKHLKFFRKYV